MAQRKASSRKRAGAKKKAGGGRKTKRRTATARSGRKAAPRKPARAASRPNPRVAELEADNRRLRAELESLRLQMAERESSSPGVSPEPFPSDLEQ